MVRTGKALALAAAAVGLGGAVACVDTGHKVPPGQTCNVPPPVPYAGSAVIPDADTATPGPYAWTNAAIKGGGFVTGIVMSPAMQGLAFARTDVGGAYRFDPVGGRWWPMTDWVGHSSSNLMGIESIAADPVDPNRVYIAAGEYLTAGAGSILSSDDMGQTFTVNVISAPMGGNVDGRSMGERLAVDPNLPSTLLFGSRNAGLFTSADYGQTWTAVAGFPTVGASGGGAGSSNSAGTGYGLTFVLFDGKSGAAGSATPSIYVGVGVNDGTATLFHSADAGATWAPVGGTPSGLFPHHAVLDGCGNLYLAFNDASGPNNVSKGAVWRYAMAEGTWTDVSPPGGGGGFGGLSADVAHPGTLLVTTIDRWSPDRIYRTTDGGMDWSGVGAAWDIAGAQWLTFGGGSVSATGLMGDVEIDPFDPAHALYITGQGLWASADVNAGDTGGGTAWTFQDAGLEETVVLDLAVPPPQPSSAPATAPATALLLSGVGDIGGFRHDDLGTSPAGGMFTNPVFSNTNSIDFAEAALQIAARVGTGSGKLGAYSTNGGTSWTPFAGAPAGSTGSGSVAVSADGTTFLWAPKKGSLSYSHDNGTTWTAATSTTTIALTAGMLVAADRVNPMKFYASGRGTFATSTDGGATFSVATVATTGRPRPVFGVEGDVWMPTSSGLLHSTDSGATFAPVAAVNGAIAVGFGAPMTADAGYPAVYLVGSAAPGVSYTWGTFRSDDAGVTWQRIDDPQHQFGYINCLAGDRRQPGRVFLGTSGRGIVYGDPR